MITDNSGLPHFVLAAEEERISKRRRELVKVNMMKEGSCQNKNGLALSGGGIRAAFIAQGFIEKLAALEDLGRFDYISSVSGGGYTACMLTDHVDNLKKRPTFDKTTYQLNAPNYNYGMIAIGYFLHFLLNFLPILGYLCFLLLLIPAPGKIDFPSKVKDNSSIQFALIIGGIVFLVYLVILYFEKSFQDKNSNHVNKAVLVKNFLKVTLFFIFVSILAFNINVIFIYLTIITVLIGSSTFVALLPHRFTKTINPIFPWLLVAFFGTVSASVVIQFGKSIIFLSSIAIAGVGAFIHPIFFNFSSQIRWNWILKYYCQGLSKRFLPFASWLTGKRKFHETDQSWNPFPIINVTANFGTVLSEYELTPLYSGSPTTGYLRTDELLPNLTLADVMTISGGALDLLKDNGTIKSLFALVIGGTNYWIPKNQEVPGKATLLLEQLYSVAGLSVHSSFRNAFRVSDGGFTENLGVIALIKRRSKLIVCLDAGYDPEFNFEDLRKLCVKILENGIAQLEIPEIHTASQERRFRQNKSNIIVGTINYPKVDGFASEKGTYIHLKISGTRHRMYGKFTDFPHLPTLDQQLNNEEIDALYELGQDMAIELNEYLGKAQEGYQPA